MHSSIRIVCPGCTCLCDDLEFSANTAQLSANVCELGKQWFHQPQVNEPAQAIDGSRVEFAAAIAAAVKLLAASSAPLICGLEELTTTAQQSAWKLADLTRANLDISLSNQGRGGMLRISAGWQSHRVAG